MQPSSDLEKGGSSDGCASSTGAATPPRAQLPVGTGADGSEGAAVHYWEEQIFHGHELSDDCR